MAPKENESINASTESAEPKKTKSKIEPEATVESDTSKPGFFSAVVMPVMKPIVRATADVAYNACVVALGIAVYGAVSSVINGDGNSTTEG